MIGRSFGRYRIVEPLGEGGMGTVWRAEDDLLGRSVALKLLGAKLADSAGARARLLREARAAGALDHPGIGTVYDAGEQDGEIFIAMRLVDGGTVADRIRSQGALGLLDAVRIAASAADALGHAHAQGILHRDVSARNLMLTKDGQVVVVDFGLALAEGASRLTQTGMAAGTAHYMAPEAVQGKAPDRRSDIYSLGAVLYEMLAGAPPFESDRLETLVYAAVHTPPSPPSAKRTAIPAELDRIVLKTLAKKPEERYASMEALRDDLDALEASGALPEDAAGPTIQPRQQTLAPTTNLDPAGLGQFKSRARKKRVAMYGLVVVVLGLAAGGITWLVRRPSVSPSPKYASLAVLPFRNTSANPIESDYLSEGLSETLINKFTQMTNLRIPPWMTVRRFRNPTIPVQKLANDLNVDAILVGAYQSDGKRIRGTVSIVDGKSGLQVWADEFDEPLADLFAVQKKIALSAATTLLGKLSGTQVDTLAIPAAASVEAYEFYLKGSLALQQQSQAGDEEALALFRRAVDRDPRSAQAWAGIGAVLSDQYYFGMDGDLKGLVAAEEAYRNALNFDPTSIPARRGLIHLFWQRGRSEECLKQGKLVATSGARGTDALLARAEAYLFGGLEDRSLPLLRQVMKEEPANPAAPWFMVVAGCWAGSYEEAVSAGQEYLEKFGEDFEVHMWMAIALSSLGRRKEVGFHFRRSIEIEPPGAVNEVRLAAAVFFRQDGKVDEADQLALETIDIVESKLARTPDNFRLHGILGGAYALVGDLAKFRTEQSLVASAPGGSQSGFVAYAGMIGEKALFVTWLRESLRAGTVEHRHRNLRAGYADPQLEDYPGFEEFATELAVEVKRLEALY